MFNNVSPQTYRRHLQDSHKEIDKVQWGDQYSLSISMISPISKAPIPKEIVKAFSIQRHSLGVEPMQIGNDVLYRFGEALPEGIQITFYNQIKIALQKKIGFNIFDPINSIEDEIFNKIDSIGGSFGFIDITPPIKNFVQDMFQPLHDFQNSLESKLGGFLGGFGGGSSVKSLFSSLVGKEIIDLNTIDYFLKVGIVDILPKDGTMLLADDWYFKIEANALNANWIEKKELSAYYIIDGEIEQEFSSDNGSLQEFTISFKKHRV